MKYTIKRHGHEDAGIRVNSEGKIVVITFGKDLNKFLGCQLEELVDYCSSNNYIITTLD